MRTSTILLAFCALLLAADNSFVARADESGECVSNPETGECINPDAAVEEHAAEESTPEEPQEIVTEPVEEAAQEAVVEEAAEEVQEAAADEATPDEAVSDAAEESEATPVEEETAPVDPVEETATEETVPATEEAPEETVAATDAEEKVEENPGCPSRKHVIKCAAQYLDTNGNNYLEREELQGAIDKLPWLSRGILSILGSVDKMMLKCDTDKDGAIGIEYDMTHNAETCLATCFKRRAFKSAFFPDCSA